METVELKFLNVLIEKLHLTDEEKIDFIEDFEKVRESRLDSSMKEIKSLFKENFHNLELKMEQNKSDIDLKFEQQNTKLEQFNTKFEQQNTKFEQFNTKLDKHRSDIDLKFDQNKSDINLKFEQFNTKLEKTKADILKSYLAGLITVVGMILALMASVIFRH